MVTEVTLTGAGEGGAGAAKNATGGSSLRCRRLGKEAGKEGGAARVAVCGRE
jgi:hypothetical protein